MDNKKNEMIAQSKHVFVSSTISGADNAKSNEIKLGEAHYSYKIARNKFSKMYNDYGYTIHDIHRPEIYFSKQSKKALPINPDGAHHLIFKPFEYVRLLKGARNIVCLAWEFSRIQTQATCNRSLLPMEDYRLVANALDEIWTPCSYASDVMQSHGIDNVRFVPAPIEVSDSAISQEKGSIPNIVLSPLIKNGWIFDLRKHHSSLAMHYNEIVRTIYNGSKPKIFIMVFNPGDMRKNPGPAIRSFVEFNAANPDSILIIKFVWSHEFGDMYDVVDTHLRGRMGEVQFLKTRSIWITDENLPATIFRKLISGAHFYVCTSFCEGQNLPLLEAMADGVVPISVAHTAMADYIENDNSVVIPSHLTSSEISISVAKNIVGAQWYGISDKDMVKSYNQAHQLSEKQYMAKSLNSGKTVEQNYSPEAIARRINLAGDEK